jgi:hypothetical protein
MKLQLQVFDSDKGVILIDPPPDTIGFAFIDGSEKLYVNPSHLDGSPNQDCVTISRQGKKWGQLKIIPRSSNVAIILFNDE